MARPRAYALYTLTLTLPVLAFTGARAPRDATAVARATRASRLLSPALAPSGAALPRYSLEERMRFYGVPGVSMAIINEGRVESVRAYGLADAEARVPVDTTTLFQAGSISKPVAAIAALRLAERGRLDLDADVNRHLKSWTLPASRYTRSTSVTTRRLLTHTAGLSVWGFPGYAPGRPVPTLLEVLNGQPPANTPAIRNDTIPGHRWLYSGGGYTVLQQLLIDVTGRPFPDLARDLVLAPLGMARSTYENPLPLARVGGAAAGHDGRGETIPGKRYTYPEMAAAGLWTTPSDLARFALAVQQGARAAASPLSPQLVRGLLTPDTLLTIGGNHWGLGLTIDGSGAAERFGHSGADAGFIAQMVAFRHTGKGAVIMTNGQRGGALIQEILRAVATEYAWPALQPVRVDTVPTDASARALAGRYVNFVTGKDTVFITLAWENGRLGVRLGTAVRTFWAEASGRFVDPVSSDAFWAELDEAGEVVAVRYRNLWQGTEERRMMRAP
ncbi:MAG TPA: serine hydrolase domain-containing protein [Gemmatimonadaceae bacterium]|nr:serine hydrolase domain-containing protein [Gemmatimonadaceae bacterium]